jgi:hypothetical protein
MRRKDELCMRKMGFEQFAELPSVIGVYRHQNIVQNSKDKVFAQEMAHQSKVKGRGPYHLGDLRYGKLPVESDLGRRNLR